MARKVDRIVVTIGQGLPLAPRPGDLFRGIDCEQIAVVLIGNQSAVAITAVAREAGVDKVLIYRYFGGLPELLRAYAEEGHFRPSADELLAAARVHKPETQADWAVYLLIEFGRILRSRPITLEIMRWEILEKNELTVTFSEYRERETARLLQFFGGRKVDDIPAMTSLLGASLTHLLLRSKAIDTYNGLHLRDDKDWKRIEKGVETLVRAAFANAFRSGV